MYAPSSLWCRIMSKSFLSLLAAAMLAMAAAAMPSSGRAATLHDNDYVRISVPDLPQAVAFFRDILDCQLINPSAPAANSAEKLRGSRLLSCDSGSIVELVDNHGRASPARASQSLNTSGEPIRFISGNVANADRWLRNEGVRVVGTPQTLTSGPDAGQTVVNFVSPWGLRLQLVGWASDVATAGP